MGINSALLTGVSGLLAQSSALAAISDNIANANTVGYKTQQTSFGDMVTNSSVVGDYDSGGVLAQSQQLVTVQGNLQQTSSATDLAIKGNGFFVTTTSADPTVTDPRNFTRAGSFTVDANGNLMNAAGGYLQGWPVNADGSITINPSSVASLQTVNVGGAGGSGGAVSPTTQVSINANLNSAETVDADAAAYNTTTASMAAYAASGGASGTKPDFTISVPVSDSQGGQRTLSLSLLKTGPNTWQAELVAPATTTGSDPTSSVTAADGQVATGSLTFDANGNLDVANSSLVDANGDNLLGANPSKTLNVNWNPSLGVESPQAVSFNLSNSLGGITQVAADSVTQSVDTNGTQFGNLTNVTIDNQGFVTAAYDNGVTRKIAQVAIATFQNPDGLTSVSGDNYQVSTASGTYNLKAAGVGGAGSIAPSTLEASTVDLSQQFAGLIVTQQAYAASTKILTTADQMLQQLISIKQ
jgi:flagellar hook protein FlgE